ncbi:efflux RND transporter periplasmic adaptor subunit [Vibrio sinaloensis]|uniref:efflux RND transporter periplasmic adaptor subunit n=2 Tax=Photobacterium sp. (strain ATCC 43367) TaxID=379097 RepID=UPI002F424BA4
MNKLALSVGLTFTLAPILFFTCQRSEAGPNAQPTAYVVQFPIERQVTQLTPLDGEIKPSQFTQIIAEHSAKIDTIYVQDGEYVDQGEPIFSFDDALPALAVKAAEYEYQMATRNIMELTRTAHENDPRLNTAVKAVDATRNNLLNAQKALKSTTVYAPFSGKMGQIRFNTGNLVNAGDLISELVATDTVEVHFMASPEVLNTFRQVLNNEPDTLKASLQSAEGSFIDGKLKYVDSSLSDQHAKLSAYAVFDNGNGEHLIGSKTTLYLNSPEPKPQLFVPEIALHTEDGIPTLFVLDEQRIVRPKQVTLATIKERYTGYVPIAEGIEATDFVLSTPDAPQLVGKKIDPMVNIVNQLNEILNRAP